jgi:large-conductance mechanosensitive channel
MDYMSFGIGIFLGVGLAAAVGFRVFLPLLILSLGSYFDYIPINESWEWIGSITAVITLAIATLVEVFGYYIPWVDNILDTIAIPLATLAGTLVMVAVVSDLDPVISWALAIIAGGGTAAAIKGSSAAVRLGSSTTTAGLGNPVIATVETGAATLMSLVSVLIPVVAFILVLFIFFGIIRFYKKLRKKQRPSV